MDALNHQPLRSTVPLQRYAREAHTSSCATSQHGTSWAPAGVRALNIMGCLVVRIVKLVGMSSGSSGPFRDLGFCGLEGVSGRVDVEAAGVVDR